MDLTDFDEKSLLHRFIAFTDPSTYRHRTAKVVEVGARKRFTIGYGANKRSRTKDAVKVKFHVTSHYGLPKTEMLIPLESITAVYLKAGPRGRRAIPFDEWVIRNRRD